jgi:hypothetical protein
MVSNTKSKDKHGGNSKDCINSHSRNNYFLDFSNNYCMIFSCPPTTMANFLPYSYTDAIIAADKLKVETQMHILWMQLLK